MPLRDWGRRGLTHVRDCLTVVKKTDTAHYTEHVYTRMLTDAQAMYVGSRARMHVDTHVYAHAHITFCIYIGFYVLNVVMHRRVASCSLVDQRCHAASSSLFQPLPD